MLLLVTIFSFPVHAATEKNADAITQEYDRLQTLWLSEMRMAPDARSIALILEKQPNPNEYAKRLKSLLRKDLHKDWTLKYGAWLLENDQGHDAEGKLNLRVKSQRALLNAVEKYHMKSPLVGRFCVAMPHLSAVGEVLAAGKVSLPIRSRGMKLLGELTKMDKNKASEIDVSVFLFEYIEQFITKVDLKVGKKKITTYKKVLEDFALLPVITGLSEKIMTSITGAIEKKN